MGRMTRTQMRIGLILAAVAGLVAACAGSAPDPAAAPVQPVVAQGGKATIVAKDIAYTPTSITTAPVALSIEFDNQDPGIPHDLVIYAGDVKLASTTITTGPSTTTLQVDQLVPGDYRFSCTVHPNMTGSLSVLEE